MADYKLTEEGKEYLEKGLPEKNLLDALEAGPLSFQEARGKIKNFDIALQWVKKKNLVRVDKGSLVLIRKEELPEQDALRKIYEGKEVDEKILQTLIERKLAEKVRHDIEELEKEVAGKEISQLSPQMIRTGMWRKASGFAPYSAEIQSTKKFPGKSHPYVQVLKEVREKMVGLGFVESRSPLVELSFWNFDALFVPQDHPARGLHDVLFIKDPKKGRLPEKELCDRVAETHKSGWITGSRGWGGKWSAEEARKLVARSHDTGISARTMHSLKREDLPYKMFFIPRVFRHEAVDAKHLAEFDQCAGIVAGENLNLRNLLGFLKEVITAVTGSKEVRFKPTYYPFTEPSVEGYVKHPKLGWIEIGGAGIFRPELTLPLGLEVPVLGWALGISRLAMIKLGLEDIRDIFSHDIAWLREKPLAK
jgi:phenylalanyl-tRNA synthetase alpha chain